MEARSAQHWILAAGLGPAIPVLLPPAAGSEIDGGAHGSSPWAEGPRNKSGQGAARSVGGAARKAGVAAASSHAAAARPLILAFGDSLTAGYGLPRQDAFPAQLEARLGEEGINARVVNAGVSGETTASGLLRLDWALADKPQLVLLEEGANDALRGISPALVRANLDKMIQRIKRSGARLLLAGMLAPLNWGRRYAQRFDRIYPDLARARQVPLYPFFLAGVALAPGLNQADGLHPNKKGVAVLVARIAPYVVALLQEKRKK
jgi:acyl-CoA thioesterase I